MTALILLCAFHQYQQTGVRAVAIGAGHEVKHGQGHCQLEAELTALTK